MAEKKCPLRQEAMVAHAIMGSCVKEECVLWDDIFKRCSIVSIAKQLQKWSGDDVGIKFHEEEIAS